MTIVAMPGVRGQQLPTMGDPGGTTPSTDAASAGTAGATVTGDSPADHIQVSLTRAYLFHQPLGTAPEAARSTKITAPERQAVLDIDRGARALGLTGAGQPVLTATVRDTLAAAFGPYASGQKVGIPKNNVIATAAESLAPAGKPVIGTASLYPYDVALHELGHVVQSQAMAKAGLAGLDAKTHVDFVDLGKQRQTLESVDDGGAAADPPEDPKATALANEQSGLREGLSDATAAVVTHDWVLGEDYFAKGSGIRAVRDVSQPHAKDVMNTIETDYKHARAGLDGTAPATRQVDGVTVIDNEGHSIGGIVSRAAYEFEQTQGWGQTTQLVATLQRDPELWKEGGTLEAFRDRFLAAARQIDAGDAKAGALPAARAALRKVGYDVSDTATGTKADPPVVPVPRDPGEQQPGSTDHHRAGIAKTLGSVALSGGVGAVVGVGLGVALDAFTPLKGKTGIIAGMALGGAAGAARGWLATS